MKTGFVSPIEYLFNVVLLAQWAMFLWYTLTPHWSKKTTILCFLPICLIAPVVATIFPSRSIARLLSVPVIMIAAAFLCFRSRPTRTVFCIKVNLDAEYFKWKEEADGGKEEKKPERHSFFGKRPK